MAEPTPAEKINLNWCNGGELTLKENLAKFAYTLAKEFNETNAAVFALQDGYLIKDADEIVRDPDTYFYLMLRHKWGGSIIKLDENNKLVIDTNDTVLNARLVEYKNAREQGGCTDNTIPTLITK